MRSASRTVRAVIALALVGASVLFVTKVIRGEPAEPATPAAPIVAAPTVAVATSATAAPTASSAASTAAEPEPPPRPASRLKEATRTGFRWTRRSPTPAARRAPWH